MSYPQYLPNMKNLFVLLAVMSLPLAGFGADYGKAIEDMIPKLANPDVPARYSAQMELQDLASKASTPGHVAERQALGQALAAKAADESVPQPARVWMVRQLEYMGGAEAVEALTRIMNDRDAELRECARRALEKNPAPTASQSLRTALEKGGEPAWETGLIHSLGQRRDAAAVPLIAARLKSASTAREAAQALGRIATPAAADLLRAEAGRNPAAGPALMEAANRLLAEGQSAQAKAIYAQLYQPDHAVSIRAAAFSGLLQADPSAAARRIKEALTMHEPRLQQIAIEAAARGTAETQRMLEVIFSQMPPSARVQIVGVLPASAEKTILAALHDDEESVRQAAIAALGRVGGANSVPALLMKASGASSTENSLASASLARISGSGALTALRQAAGYGAPQERAAAMSALAERQDAGAIPALLASAREEDQAVRTAAFSALGKLASDKEVGVLGKMTLQNPSEEALAALESVVRGVKNPAGAAQELLALAGNKEEAVITLLPVFSALGDERALEEAVKQAKSGTGETREKAFEALCNWENFQAAKPLLAMATDPNTPEARSWAALQGVLRLVDTQEKVPAAIRAEAGLAALRAARGEREKKQALAALGNVPDAKVVSAIIPLLVDPVLKNEAGRAAANLAELIVETDKATAQDLARKLKEANISRQLTQRANAVLKR